MKTSYLFSEFLVVIGSIGIHWNENTSKYIYVVRVLDKTENHRFQSLYLILIYYYLISSRYIKLQNTVQWLVPPSTIYIECDYNFAYKTITQLVKSITTVKWYSCRRYVFLVFLIALLPLLLLKNTFDDRGQCS